MTRVALLGGGGFRTPLIYQALLSLAERVPIAELRLYDVDNGRLERMRLVLEGIAEERSPLPGLPVCVAPTLESALDQVDFVFCAIRVGGLEGRVVDESVPLGEGIVGQETTGPGGICLALRTLPVVLHIADVVARRAPRAWFINFTNPVGVVTEALQGVLGARAIGVCDTPVGLCARVARALGRPAEELWFDYFGLNHLGWLRAVWDASGDRLPGLLADDAALATLEEARLFGADRLRSLGMIPNEYLAYYYAAPGVVETIAERGYGRGEYLLEQQAAFYATDGQGPQGGSGGEPIASTGTRWEPDALGSQTPAQALAAWRQARDERARSYLAEVPAAAPATCRELATEVAVDDEGLGYASVAAALVEALATTSRTVLILNVANRSSLPFLDASAVVEVPCVVGPAGPVPVAIGDVYPHRHAHDLLQALKAVERATMEAAVMGSRARALEALVHHPLVPSRAVAERILAAYLDRHPTLAEQLT